MKYLFYLLNEYSFPIIDPLIKYLNDKKSGNQYKFFVSKKLVNKIPTDWELSHQLKTLYQLKKYQPDFVISPENYLDYRIPGLKVQIFHGVGIEKKSHYVIRDFYDIYLTSGPIVTARYDKLAQQLGHFKVIETGWPKFDHILNYSIKGSIYQKLKKTTHKYILYAPTFSRKMQSANALLETILNQKKENEIWFIKFHELMSQEIVAQFENIKNPNFLLIRENNITPYLHLADIMISDTSSVIYEFLALEKPVITFRSIANYDKGINITEPEELRKTIDLLISDPYFDKEKRMKMLMQVNPYLDGKVSERVFSALENIKNEGFKVRKNKPLNLFRKAKILLGNY